MREALSDPIFWLLMILPAIGLVGVIVASFISECVRRRLPQIALGLAILALLVSVLTAVCHAACTWDKAEYVLIVGPVADVRHVEPVNVQVTNVNDGWTLDSMNYWGGWVADPDYFRVFYFETLDGLSDYLGKNFAGSAVLVDLRAGKLKHIHQTEIVEPDTVIQRRVKGYDWTVK